MEKKTCVVIRNIISVFAGIIIYLVVDTFIRIIAGVLLNNFTQLEADTIYFQVVLNFIVVASNARLITLVCNRIAPRNSKGYNISEYIIGTLVIVSVVTIAAINLSYGNFDIRSIIFSIFSLILGVLLFLDAKEELM